MNKNSERPFAESADYRLSRHTLELGVVGTLFFSLAGVISVTAALLNTDGSFRRPGAAAIVFGTGWGCLELVGCWLILAYYRHRLSVGTEIVRTTGCFRMREVLMSVVTRAKWSSFPKGGSFVLYDPNGHLTIYFSNYSFQERAKLIQFFRTVMEGRSQEGWERFEQKCMPPHVEYAEARSRIQRILRFTVIAWAVALPAMYAILIWLKLSGGLPNGNWSVVVLFPPLSAAVMTGLMWFASRGDLARAESHQDDH